MKEDSTVPHHYGTVLNRDEPLELRAEETPAVHTEGALAAWLMLLNEDSKCQAAPIIIVINVGHCGVVPGIKHACGASLEEDWHPSSCRQLLPVEREREREREVSNS